MKIRSMGSELFHADGRTGGQTDLIKLIVALAILRNRLKIVSKIQTRWVWRNKISWCQN